MQHAPRPRLEGEQRVEARDSVRLGRRNLEPLADVPEGSFAHEPDPRLRGLESGQEQIAAPVRIADDTVDRVPLVVGRLRCQEAEVH